MVSPSPSRHGCLAWGAGCFALLLSAALIFTFIIALLYAEEDWRGARAWQKARADLKAQGESLDPSKIIPAPVSNVDNFGALPFFKNVPDPKSHQSRPYDRLAVSLTIRNVTEHLPYSKGNGLEPDTLPYLGNWQKGESADVAAIQKQLETFLRKQKPNEQIPADTKAADIFTQICPVLTELRVANATHPDCRFEMDYANTHPWDLSFGPMADNIAVARALSYDERLALISDRPDQALEDLQVSWKIDAGLRQEPYLVSGLVAIGVMAIQLGVVDQGLADHVWNDQQLTALDDDLGKIDFLSETQTCLRGETVLFSLPMVDYSVAHRSSLMEIFHAKSPFTDEDDSTWEDPFYDFAFWLIPQGWFDRYKADTSRKVLGGASIVDPVTRRVYPERETKLFPIPNENASRWDNFINSLAHPILNGVEKFAYQQVQVDEARISCRLERYRLAHGPYPAALEELIPAYGADLPHDVMNGEAYRYKLNADQTYVLYSVGWDQKDDSGNAGKTRNTDSPDWIWTNYPNQRPAK